MRKFVEIDEFNLLQSMLQVQIRIYTTKIDTQVYLYRVVREFDSTHIRPYLHVWQTQNKKIKKLN